MKRQLIITIDIDKLSSKLDAGTVVSALESKIDDALDADFWTDYLMYDVLDNFDDQPLVDENELYECAKTVRDAVSVTFRGLSDGE